MSRIPITSPTRAPAEGAGGVETDTAERTNARRRLRRVLPRSLRGRLAVTYAGLVVVVMAGLGLYLALLLRSAYVDRLADRLAVEARMVGDDVGSLIAAGAGVAEVDPIADRAAVVLAARVTIVAADGVVLGESERDPAGTESRGGRSEITGALRDGFGVATRDGASGGAAYLFVAAPVERAPGAIVRVAVPLAQVDSAVRRVQRDVGIATLIALTLVSVVGAFVAGRIAGPLDDLRWQARAVAAGRLDVAVEPAQMLELAELGQAFNAMTRQLRSSAEEVQRSRLRLEATLAGLTDGVIITDEFGTVLRVNATAFRLLGLPVATPVGQPFVQLSRDHELSALLRVALATGGDRPRVAVVEHGRSRRVMEATARRLSGPGERLGLVVLRDVTELRRLESVRREFVANVSHELRTPLASIKALVETLEAGAVDDPEVAGDFLHRIVGEVDRLAAIVDELLDLARLESGRVALRPEALAPANLLSRATDRLRSQIDRARLDLVLAVPVDLPRVRADRARVEQVMLNLVHNAIKFTPPGGTITVEALVEDGMVRVNVRDTGAGVSPEELPRLFERFYKADKARRSDGTGLGLAIAKHIVQAHGGAIGAESPPGTGATFFFTLPLADPTPHLSSATDAPAAAAGAQRLRSPESSSVPATGDGEPE